MVPIEGFSFLLILCLWGWETTGSGEGKGKESENESGRRSGSKPDSDCSSEAQESDEERPAIKNVHNARDVEEGDKQHLQPGIVAGVEDLMGLQDLLVHYSTAEIEEATRGFTNRLGRGAFGSVYQGKLRGTEVAVKRLMSCDAKESGLAAELRMLSRIKHPNIVCLMGLSPDTSHPCIVYVHLSGGDLHESLHPESGRPRFTCLDRFRVAKEIACALAYMHSHTPCIVHRDLKPRNVMLDQHRTAKIADWGLARHIENTMSNQTLAGTRGYIPPELAGSGRELSTAADVFAFGVLLLQLMTGILQPGGLHGLASRHGEEVLGQMDAALFIQHLDPHVESWPEDLAQRVVQIALRCVAMERSERPVMARDVLPELTAVYEAGVLAKGQACRTKGIAERGTAAPPVPARMKDEGSGRSSKSGRISELRGLSSTNGSVSSEGVIDYLVAATTLLESMDLSPEEKAEAGELLFDERRARLFCTFSDATRKAWIKKQLGFPLR